MYRKLLVLLPLVYLPCLIFSQEINIAKLDSFFNALEANNKFMGSVAVSKKGVSVYLHSTGYTDVESLKKANQNTKYRIGSVSKTFTAVLILKGLEEKKLQLDQTIKKYFPDLQNADQITINHLLYHRSGIHDFTEDADYMTWNTLPKTEKEMVDIITRAGSDVKPDSLFSYSNSNYVLLSYILADVYQKPFAQILEEKIISPLALKSTYFGEKIDITKNESNSYTYSGEWIKSTETDMSIPMGAGGIVSSASDLVKLQDALLTSKLLSKESMQLMTSNNQGAAMGLFPLNFYSSVGFGHTGGIDGFSSLIAYFPADSVSMAIVSNGSNYNLNDIGLAVLSGAYGLSFDIPDFTTITLTAEELEKYLGVYSSPDFPIKLTITRNENVLMAQGTGQPMIALEASAKDTFRFDPAGLVLEFKPDDRQVIVNQGGGVYVFTKE